MPARTPSGVALADAGARIDGEQLSECWHGSPSQERVIEQTA
jgi:hypothetical protein